MEAETNNRMADDFPAITHHRFSPFIVPAILVSIGYVDPGKWVATVEGGARFGGDLVVLMLVFNFAAILCQYLSARIGVATGKDLAQVCSEEYDKWTCMALGVQAELSVILLDLTMVLGIAHGLNHLFEWDLFTCVFLTASNAVLFPIFSTLMENCRVKLVSICIAGFVLALCILGALINHPEMTFTMNGMLTKFNGESAFTLMSLLGATIMPHNFYLHSSIVQNQRGPENVSKNALFHNHFLVILCVFSGIYIVNYVLLSAAANAFYSSGLVLLTFQDAMSLVEQVFKGPIATIASLSVLFVSNQITVLNWGVGGQAVLHGFLRIEIPGWLHCSTLRIVSIVPALYCVWSSGAEGMYELLILAQVMVALLLPASVIPLFRIAASRQIMRNHRISQPVEFLTLVAFVGMLGLKIAFAVEMVFGESDWVGNLWAVGGAASGSYLVLLGVVSASFCLMLWLAATPLKSASIPSWGWDSSPKVRPDPIFKKEEFEVNAAIAVMAKQESSSPVVLKLSESHSEVTTDEAFDFGLPDSIMEPEEPELRVTTVEETSSSIAAEDQLKPVRELVSDIRSELLDIPVSERTTSSATNAREHIEKTVGFELDLQAEKDDEEADSWETEDLSKGFAGPPSLTAEGPGSFRSLKSEDGGNGAGSLSRLAGLGRAARRQLAAVLEEFWGQLYDYHGQLTHEARAKKLDLLFGADLKSSGPITGSTAKPDIATKESPPGFSRPQNQRASPSAMWSASQIQLLEAYAAQNSSNRSGPDVGERRYSSVRNIPSTDSWGDYQPATVHGYQIASYLKRSSDSSNGQSSATMQAYALKPSATFGGSAGNYRDSVSYAMGQKLQNGLSSAQVSNIQSLVAASSRSNLIQQQQQQQQQTERPYYALCPSSGPAAPEKKYHSSPNIHRDIYAERVPQWDNTTRTGFGYSNPRAVPAAAAPLAFDELSPSRVYRDALSSPMSTGFESGASLWSRQPFEQFGISDTAAAAARARARASPAKSGGIASATDIEAKLLQSFRHCILKLLKLEGSEWLFRQSDGADEELVDRVAAREKFLYEAEAREMSRAGSAAEAQYGSSPPQGERRYSSLRSGDVAVGGFSPAPASVFSVPHCGEGCVWRAELVVSFGVWCIHRVLDLSLMESRPELWGKYTYVLNRLQGIIEPAFSKPRTAATACFCLHVPASVEQRSSPPVANGMPPPPAKSKGNKCTTTAAAVLEMIKDVEIAISCRKGRTGTAAGEVAFPKGKENLASVLKRYKRRLSSIKPSDATARTKTYAS